MRTLTLAFIFCLTTKAGFSQNKAAQARALADAAIELVDAGKLDEGIAKLEEAEKLDPENIDYPYEIAYALYYKKDYKAAEKKLRPLTGEKNVTASVYQLLGNCYDMLGDADKAINTYDAGLKKFPDAGNLYLEKGVMKLGEEEYNDALAFFEEGLERDPDYPSNYYWAAKLFLSSTEEVWGMIYGEIFMNLERNSRRTQEMSKLLYDTYQSEITFQGDTSISYSFSQLNVVDISSGKFELPYGVGVYEPTLGMALSGVTSTDLENLNTLRTNFISAYYKLGNDKKYPNVLFSYEKQIAELGFMDAYNHWILMFGDNAAFKEWKEAHSLEYDTFIQWFTNNPLNINNKDHFYRGQYN